MGSKNVSALAEAPDSNLCVLLKESYWSHVGDLTAMLGMVGIRRFFGITKGLTTGFL